jgi:hypothetical protein
MRSAFLVLGGGVSSLVVVAAVGAIAMRGLPPDTQLSALVFFGYAVGFYIFLTGLGTLLRARTSSSMVSRVLLFTILFAIAGGPWIVAAIAGLIIDSSSNEAFIIAAPSPFYVFVMIDAIRHTRGESLVFAGFVAIFVWACLGLIFLVLARSRCARIIAEHEVMLAETVRILDAEDAAEARAAAGIPEEPAPEQAATAAADTVVAEVPSGATS